MLLNTDTQMGAEVVGVRQNIISFVLDPLIQIMQPKTAMALLQAYNYFVSFGAYSQNCSVSSHVYVADFKKLRCVICGKFFNLFKPQFSGQ